MPSLQWPEMNMTWLSFHSPKMCRCSAGVSLSTDSFRWCLSLQFPWARFSQPHTMSVNNIMSNLCLISYRQVNKSTVSRVSYLVRSREDVNGIERTMGQNRCNSMLNTGTNASFLSPMRSSLHMSPQELLGTQEAEKEDASQRQNVLICAH